MKYAVHKLKKSFLPKLRSFITFFFMMSAGANPISNEDDVINVLLDQVHRHIKLAEFFSKLLEGKLASMSSRGSLLASTVIK